MSGVMFLVENFLAVATLNVILEDKRKMNHPLRDFWKTSGWWDNLHQQPENGMSEGRLCIETWNAAVQKAIDIQLNYGNDEVTTPTIKIMGFYGLTPRESNPILNVLFAALISLSIFNPQAHL